MGRIAGIPNKVQEFIPLKTEKQLIEYPPSQQQTHYYL